MSKMLLLLLVILSGFGISGCLCGRDSVFYADHDKVTIDREAFRQRMEARLQEFERRLEDLRNKAIDARAEVRTTLRLEIDELHLKQEAARRRLNEMWRNGADRWEEDRLHMEAALDDLRVGFERAFSRFP